MMSEIKVTDFYYGAALSVLFNNSNKKTTAALIESDKDRQLYCIMTDNAKCRLFVKYRSDKINTKTEDYYSWLFKFSENEQHEIKTLINEGYGLVLALVCGVEGLSGSELALIDKKQIKELLGLGKDSITISRRKGEHAYRISIGGGRENAMQVKANRFDELF
ncbi:MAG: hypothetical protein WBI21_02900 [Natronincolaceae bacterium]|jgi:hypothetical protein